MLDATPPRLEPAPTMGFPPHPPLQLGSAPNEVAFRAAILKPATPQDEAAYDKAWDQQGASNKPDSWVPEQAGQKPPTETQWGEPLPYATMEYLLKRREEARLSAQPAILTYPPTTAHPQGQSRLEPPKPATAKQPEPSNRELAIQTMRELCDDGSIHAATRFEAAKFLLGL